MDALKYQPESSRLQFLIDRDGLEETLKFARRTMEMYRKHVVNGLVPRDNKRTFIKSYLAFKKFLSDNRST